MTTLRNAAFAVAVLASALFVPTAGAEDRADEVLANSDVVALTRAGLAAELVAAKVQSTPGRYDISSRGIIALKENGVPDEVIRAMMAANERPAAGPALDRPRLRTELENIMSGRPEAQTSGLAWIVANQASTLPALRSSLSDPVPEVRAAAAMALSRTMDQASLPAIRTLLSDSSPMVRREAAQALVEMRDQPTLAAAEQAIERQVNPLDGYIRVAGYAKLTRTARTLGNIVTANPDANNRAAAAWALGEIGRAGGAGRAGIERALETDASPAVRREAAAAVAKFHDSQAAKLLEGVCSRDPEVRNVTLAAMAEYPESVEFLIGVMSLGPDQIAADELETARSSLTRLTGQDYRLDGVRWAEWYAVNRSRFIAMQPLLDIQPSDAPPPPMRGAPEQIDIMALGIVADSAAIPMAPNVDAVAAGVISPAPGAAPGMAASPFSLTSSLDGLNIPPPAQAGSAASFAPARSPGGMDIPSAAAVPEMNMGSGDALSASPGMQPQMRTWSSEPSAAGGSGFGPPQSGWGAASSQAGWREIDVEPDWDRGIADVKLPDDFAGEPPAPPPGRDGETAQRLQPSPETGAPPSGVSSLRPPAAVPPQPAATPARAPAPTIFAGDSGAVGGLALPLPPMEGGSQAVAATPSEPAAQAFPPADRDDPGAGGLPADPYADPFDMTFDAAPAFGDAIEFPARDDDPFATHDDRTAAASASDPFAVGGDDSAPADAFDDDPWADIISQQPTENADGDSAAWDADFTDGFATGGDAAPAQQPQPFEATADAAPPQDPFAGDPLPSAAILPDAEAADAMAADPFADDGEAVPRESPAEDNPFADPFASDADAFASEEAFFSSQALPAESTLPTLPPRPETGSLSAAPASGDDSPPPGAIAPPETDPFAPPDAAADATEPAAADESLAEPPGAPPAETPTAPPGEEPADETEPAEERIGIVTPDPLPQPETSGSSFFVDPEPGQTVIGDSLFDADARNKVASEPYAAPDPTGFSTPAPAKAADATPPAPTATPAATAATTTTPAAPAPAASGDGAMKTARIMEDLPPNGSVEPPMDRTLPQAAPQPPEPPPQGKEEFLTEGMLRVTGLPPVAAPRSAGARAGQ